MPNAPQDHHEHDDAFRISHRLSRTEKGTLVRLERDCCAYRIDGRFEAASSKFVAVSVVVDGFRPEGISFVRREDVSRFTAPAPYSTFMESAISKMRTRLPRMGPEIRLDSWRSIVESAMHVYELVTVFKEITDPDVCYIGRLVAATSRTGTFMTISPSAEWDREASEYVTIAWRDVTRVDVATPYDRALRVVGGPPPKTVGVRRRVRPRPYAT